MTHRTPGPICGSQVDSTWVGDGTLVRTRSFQPGPLGIDSVSAEERELLLDVTQMTLDLVGVIDPTPLSDGSGALLSAGRGDWVGAGLSGLGLIPFVGDLAKAGKLGRWGKTLHAVALHARRNAHFAARVRPAVQRLAALLDQVPSSMLPRSARATLDELKAKLAQVLGRSRRVVGTQLIDEFVEKWTRYIDELELKPTGENHGALWSKLDAKRPGDPGFAPGADDPSIKGFELAATLAKNSGGQTLEMALGPSKFAEKFKLAEAQLTEQLGRAPEWEEFGAKVWERISVKYVKQLKGRVTVYVDDWVLGDAIKKGNTPILSNELKELMRRKDAGDGITEIVVKGIFETTGPGH